MNNQRNIIDIDGRKYVRDFFTYVANVETLTSGASLTDTFNIEADSTFTAVKLAFMADIAGGAQTDATRVVPLVRLSITDTGSGRNLQNQPVPLASIAGDGRLPFVLPVPRIFQPRAAVTCTFENYSAATDYANVELAFIGFKMWQL